MATTANLPPGAQGIDLSDPFVSTPNLDPRQRFSAFNSELFSIYTNSSPAHAKRALEAHLAETERRLQEASQLGTVLVQQRKELGERLKDVERQQEENELGTELRQKLVDLEREFNDVGKDTARAFLPKSRVPSGESPEKAGGATVFTSEGSVSPTKVNAPLSRKQRNQAPNRVHDIRLATEISSSLLQQLRDLQAVLAEKDDALKAADSVKSRLEVEVEGLSQRLRALDESEQRYKDENWSLETRLQDILASSRDFSEKEKKFNQSLAASKSEKSALERELEELRQAHSKLSDDHANLSKNHESELSGLRRNATAADTERGNMQRKIEELVAQNQELARAVSYRMRMEDQSPSGDLPSDGDGLDMDRDTPDHSPPASPTKGTPRHGQLEAETLKSSLHHAHRLIQNLKNNIHREKTEKSELRRMLQDARDELDSKRRDSNASGSASKKKKSKNEEVFKKPLRPSALGAHRSSREEISIGEPDWEDEDGPGTPSKSQSVQIATGRQRRGSDASDDTITDAFETATEHSDAFETANERDGNATETDAFHTGAETLDGNSSDDSTETEGLTSRQSTIRGQRPAPIGISSRPGNRSSFHSTASTSADEDDMDVRTPIQASHPRYRLKVNRGASRHSSRQDFGAESPAQVGDSPASLPSNRSTPVAGGQSLAAELGNLSGDSDNESYAEGTPEPASAFASPHMRRRSTIDKSPLANVTQAKPEMIDSGVMTEDWQPESSSILSNATTAVGTAVAGLAGFALGKENKGDHQEPENATSASRSTNQDLLPSLSLKDVKQPSLAFSEPAGQHLEPIKAALPVPQPIQNLSISSIGVLSTEPVEPAPKLAPALEVSRITSVHHVEPVHPQLPSLGLSSLSKQAVEPIEASKPDPVTLNFSSVTPHHVVEPKEPATPIVPLLGVSSIVSHHAVEPKQPVRSQPPQLGMSSITPHHSIEPREAVKPAPPQLGISSISAHHTVEPKEPAKPVVAQLGLSSVASHHVVEPAEPTRSVPTPLNISTLESQHVQPSEAARPESPVVPGLVPVPLPMQDDTPKEREAEQPVQKLAVSDINSWDVTPVAPVPASLSLSNMTMQHTQPKTPPTPAPLSLSAFASQHTEPLHVPEPTPVPLTMSTLASQQTEPLHIPPMEPVTMSLSQLSSQHTEPQPPAEAIRAPYAYSSINSQETEPKSRPPFTFYGGSSRSAEVPIIAEDETSQPISSLVEKSTTDEERQPLRAIDANSIVQNHGDEEQLLKSQASHIHTADEGTQTLLSAMEIDKMTKSKMLPVPVIVPTPTSQSIASINKLEMSPRSPRRPGSANSQRSRTGTPPPLPSDHKEAIAAASQRAAGTMGPPLIPASAYRQNHPRTPSFGAKAGPSGTSKDGRPIFRSARSDVSTPVTRRSSVSSFASDLDQRFNIRGPVQDPVDANITDPRMIQAITQTMIGEWLWKYTRKAGSENMSQTRHRRFFWVHPYTRTLYWSENDPSTAGSAQLKAKSVAIEGVQVVTDDNPMPPGLHRKSLIVFTPGRAVKFTATTSQRHETWFNALSYLLLRTGSEREQNADSEDVSEFNPSYQRSSSRATGRSQVSTTSRATSRTAHRVPSPHRVQHPTLTTRNSAMSATSQRASVQTPPPQGSLSSRLSSFTGMFRPSPIMRGSFSSRRSRNSAQEADSSLYEASTVVHDSAEDLRNVIEQQEREADRLENVRACCDGKHDVGSLSGTTRYSTVRGRHSHNHGTASSRHSAMPSNSRMSSYGANSHLHHENELVASNFSAS